MGRKVTTLNNCLTKLNTLGTGFPSMAYIARNVNVPYRNATSRFVLWYDLIEILRCWLFVVK